MSLRYGRGTGYFQSVGEGGTFEQDTLRCQHCQFTIFFKPFCDPADVGGYCRCCSEIICPKCVKRGVCITVEEMLQHQEGGWIDKAKLEEWERAPILAIGTLSIDSSKRK